MLPTQHIRYSLESRIVKCCFLELNLGRCEAVWIAVVRTSDVRTATNLHPQSRCQAVTCCFIPAEARRSGFGLLGAVVFVSWLSSCLLSFHEEAAGDLRRGWLRCWHLLAPQWVVGGVGFCSGADRAWMCGGGARGGVRGAGGGSEGRRVGKGGVSTGRS